MARIMMGVDEFGHVFVESDNAKQGLPVELTAGEDTAMQCIYRALSNIGISAESLVLQRRTHRYFSVVAFETCDFIRVKVGVRSVWFSVFLSIADREELADDIRFIAQKNKQQYHWQIKLSNAAEFSLYDDLFQRGYRAAVWSHQITEANSRGAPQVE